MTPVDPPSLLASFQDGDSRIFFLALECFLLGDTPNVIVMVWNCHDQLINNEILRDTDFNPMPFCMMKYDFAWVACCPQKHHLSLRLKTMGNIEALPYPFIISGMTFGVSDFMSVCRCFVSPAITTYIIYIYIYIGSGTFLYNCPSVFRLTCTVLVDVVGDVVNPNFFFLRKFWRCKRRFFFLT